MYFMANSGVPVSIVKFIAEAHIQEDMAKADIIAASTIILLNLYFCSQHYGIFVSGSSRIDVTFTKCFSLCIDSLLAFEYF